MLNVGHTGITWGIPGDVVTAYSDVAELGYRGFETFGHVIAGFEGGEGGYAALTRRCGIPTVAGYCTRTWLDPATGDEDVASAVEEAKRIREVGVETVVLACGKRDRAKPMPDDDWKRLAAGLMEAARRCQQLGLRVGLHPHTGTTVETGEDIATILDLTEQPLGFAPDSGQIAKGGADVVEVFSRYLDRITHVHLKDWGGTRPVDAEGREIDETGYVNYTVIGEGVVPIPRLLRLLEDAGFDGWVNVELDGTPRAPYEPREAAARARAYLEQVMGAHVAWRAPVEGQS